MLEASIIVLKVVFFLVSMGIIAVVLVGVVCAVVHIIAWMVDKTVGL